MSHNLSLEIKNSQLKLTPTREQVLRIFHTATKPLSLGDVEKHVHTSDLATLYRTVSTFLEKGLLRQVDFRDGKGRYELAEKQHHHHVVCVVCGSVEDISKCNIDSLEKEILKKTKFKSIQTHSLEFFGICGSCSN